MTSASNLDPRWHDLIASALPSKQPLSMNLRAEDDNRHRLTVTATLRAGPTRQLEIALAQKTAQSLPPEESHRVQCCLKVWIPWLIKLHRRLRCDYSITLSMCDGGQPGIASMDSAHPHELIPDLYAMQAALKPEKNGKPLSFSRFYARWQTRHPQVFWRGGTTGIQPGGAIADVSRLATNPRVNVYLQQRHTMGCNIKISRVVQTDPAFTTQAEDWLQSEGILAEPVPESTFWNYRYYPDLPGNALAWGTIFKHLRGCLVFRAPQKRSLYYYRLMQPGQHYMEVQPDFSDLDTTLQWAESHPEQAAWIAWCGHRVAHRYLKQIGSHFSDAAMAQIQPLLTALI